MKSADVRLSEGNFVFRLVAYQFGCSLSTIRREWRNIDPDVRRGQWQVDEDEVQMKFELNFFNRSRIIQ